MDLLTKSKRIDEKGQEVPLSAEELLKIATTKAKVDFKKALGDLRMKVEPLAPGIDHHHGTVTKFENILGTTVQTDDVKITENDPNTPTIIEIFPVDSVMPENPEKPERKFPNLKMALIELACGTKIPAPPLDLIGADPILNQNDADQTARAQKDTHSNFYNLLAELHSKVPRALDEQAKNDPESQTEAAQDQARIDAGILGMKSNMLKMLGELTDKHKRIEYGDANEDAGLALVQRCMYLFSDTFNPEDMIMEEGEDVEVTEHEVTEAVSLKARKHQPVSQAIGGFLDKLFGDSKPMEFDEHGEAIPEAPELISGRCVPPAPPIHAGILSDVNEKIIDKLNRDASVTSKTNLMSVLAELLSKVPKNTENIATSDGEAITGEAAFEAKKKLDTLCNIHSMFAELKQKIPKLDSNGKPEKKSQDDLNSQFSQQWKAKFCSSMAELLSTKKPEPAISLQSKLLTGEAQSNALAQSGLKGKADFGSVLQEIKEKVPYVDASKDYAHVLKSMFVYMTPHVVEHFDAETEDVIEVCYAEDKVQLKAQKKMVSFHRAVGGLLGLLDKGFEKDTKEERFDVGSFTRGAHDLRNMTIGKNAGTKGLVRGAPLGAGA